MVTNPDAGMEVDETPSGPDRGTVFLTRPVIEQPGGNMELLTFRNHGASHFGARRGGGARMHLATDYSYAEGSRLMVPEAAHGKWTMRHVGLESGVGGQNSFWEIGRDNAGHPIVMSSRHNTRPPEGFTGPTGPHRGASGRSGGENYNATLGEGREVAVAGVSGTNTTGSHFDLGLARLMPDGTQQRIDAEWAFRQVEAGADPNTEEFWQRGMEHTKEVAQRLASETGASAERYYAQANGRQGDWRLSHITASEPEEEILVAGQELPDAFRVAKLGNSRDALSAAEFLALIGNSTEDQLVEQGLWLAHDSQYGGSQTVRGLQTTELKNYYPQPGTEGLSGRAAKIAADGKLGEITHHAAKLQQDEDGSFAKEHIAASLQVDHWDDSSLLKLDASLNRHAEVVEGTDVAAVDGVFREADATRVAEYVEDWRAEHNGEVFQLGAAAIHGFIRSNYDADAIAEMTGMDVEDVTTKFEVAEQYIDRDKLAATASVEDAMHQVGTQHLIDAMDEFGITDPRQRAYVLATAYHEVGPNMAPVRESFASSDAQAVRNLRGHSYAQVHGDTGKAYFGRGYVQLTWRENYAKLGAELGVDLVNNPDQLLQNPELSARVTVLGMRDGLFTGKTLDDYFSGPESDPFGARRIINGTDRASRIANTYGQFLSELEKPEPALIAGTDTPTSQDFNSASGIGNTPVDLSAAQSEIEVDLASVDPKDAKFSAETIGRSAAEMTPGFKSASVDMPSAQGNNTPTTDGPKTPTPAPAGTTPAPA